MQKFLVIFAVAAVLCLCEAKKFDRCGLVRELRRQGFPEDKMRDWVCLVEHESSRDTSKTNTNRNGSKDYGLFQINDNKSLHPFLASDLLTDDITKAAKCAQKIYKRHQFQAWYGWKNHCQSAGSLPDISGC
ncbi:Lysozyme [Operophtera brumata]|uniref:lysozyme n=1 Tax=Operophtera brumata TaxID=104452 RepID=A0A0L7LQW1_OPEBR|nr:Lysozyme [Operophtera brumata]